MTNRDNSRMKSRLRYFAKAGRTAVLGVALLAQTTLAATYSYDSAATQRTLYVQVPDNATETFDATYMAPAGASVTNLVKRGDGTLDIPNGTDLTAYSFDIRVEDGIFKFSGKNVLSTAGGTIIILDGATIWNSAGGGSGGIGNKWTTYFTGTGHNGMGALYRNFYAYGGSFGKWVLNGDAKVVMCSAEDHMDSVDLNGHILDLFLQNGYFINEDRIENGGEIRVHGNPAAASFAEFQSWNGFYGGSENLISFSNTTWRVASTRQRTVANPGIEWGMAFEDKSAMLIRTGTYKGGNSDNSWWGPVAIRRDRLSISVPAGKEELGFNFKGAVSGGGFDLQGLDTTTLSLRLSNASNTFTNGVTGRYADLHLVTDGALPASGGALVLTNSAVTLEDATVSYSLPAAEFSGTSSVKGGRGAWTRLAKTGTGKLAYDSAVGALALNIAEGTVDLTAIATNRSAFSGLAEGRRDTSGDAAYSRFTAVYSNTGSIATNAVTSGTRLLYENTWNETGWAKNSLISYTGYIWNNSPTNEVWAFAGANGSEWRLDIDGALVCGWCDWYGRGVKYSNGANQQDVATNKVEMAPGPHRFAYRTTVRYDSYNGLFASTSYLNGNGTYRSSYTGDLYENWLGERGLMYNRNGVCSRDINDYQQLIDPGDGSLLTWDIPPANGTLPHPVTGDPVNPRPTFNALCMAADTAMLVPNGSTWTFSTVEGWPTVTGGSVAVTDSLKIDGDNVGRAAFAISGTLSFGPGACFVAPEENEKPVDRGRGGTYIVGTAAGGIVNAPVSVTDGRWRVFAEGNAVKAVYVPEATVIFIR